LKDEVIILPNDEGRFDLGITQNDVQRRCPSRKKADDK
tara:strand:- start:453 stop:566 length:114 start_codon:yes stop_codon:yes gene_type:complete